MVWQNLKNPHKSNIKTVSLIFEPTWLKKKVNNMNLKNPIIAVVKGKLCINNIIFEHDQLRESKQYLQSLGYSEALFYPANDEDLNELEEVMSIMSGINCEASGDETLSYYLNQNSKYSVDYKVIFSAKPIG